MTVLELIRLLITEDPNNEVKFRTNTLEDETIGGIVDYEDDIIYLG